MKWQAIIQGADTTVERNFCRTLREMGKICGKDACPEQKYYMQQLMKPAGMDNTAFTSRLKIMHMYLMYLSTEHETHHMREFDDDDDIANTLYQSTLEGDILMEVTKRTTTILDAHYEKADINAFIGELTNSESVDKTKLKSLLFEYEQLFDGMPGNWKTTPVDFELKSRVQLFHSRAFSVPAIHEAPLCKECERLVEIDVLRQSNGSEWGFPMFIIPKKNNTVRFISDFRKLNAPLKRTP
jgi:hypothetical protein